MLIIQPNLLLLIDLQNNSVNQAHTKEITKKVVLNKFRPQIKNPVAPVTMVESPISSPNPYEPDLKHMKAMNSFFDTENNIRREDQRMTSPVNKTKDDSTISSETPEMNYKYTSNYENVSVHAFL